MAFPIVFKNREWDLSKSKYDEIDELPLMRTPGPVLMILAAYLLFVLKVGPSFMRKREAYKLKSMIVLYNGIQVAASAYMVGRYFQSINSDHGLFPKACLVDFESTRTDTINHIWIYFAAKISELVDTIFFVFRKKDNQITFLHLYHHSIMVIATWALLKYSPTHLVIFIGFLNSLVHVLMYTYYALAAFGDKFAKYLTWKKYMTTIQLIQFIIIVIHFVVAVRTSECPPSRGVATMVACNTLFILLLFLNFYRTNYRSKALKKTIVNGNAKTNVPVKTDSIKEE